MPRDDGQNRESDEMNVFQKYRKAQWSLHFYQPAKVLKGLLFQQKLEQELYWESIQGQEIAAESSQHTSETCSEDIENEDSLIYLRLSKIFLSPSLSSLWSEAWHPAVGAIRAQINFVKIYLLEKDWFWFLWFLWFLWLLVLLYSMIPSPHEHY